MRFCYEDCMRSQIFENLFIGPCPHSVEATGQIARLGVDAVMSLQTDSDMAFHNIDWPRLISGFSDQGIQVHHYPIEDSVESVRKRLTLGVECLARLLEDGTVYLHCIAGINRSPTLIAAYLMTEHGYSLDDSMAFVSEKHCSSPYMEALLDINMKSGENIVLR
jgi:hypothetical protein